MIRVVKYDNAPVSASASFKQVLANEAYSM